MLETIRQLSRALKLKDLVINNFIPEEYCRAVERKAQWNPEEDLWLVPMLEFSGNNRDRAKLGGGDKRAVENGQVGMNNGRVEGDDGGDIIIPEDLGIGNPYLQYGGGAETSIDAKSIQGAADKGREKSSKASGSSSRPKSAARKK